MSNLRNKYKRAVEVRDNLKDEIKSINLGDVIENYFKKDGKSQNYFCKFHHNVNTGSLSYNKNANNVHCFSCNQSWDLIQIYRDLYNLDYNQALGVIGREFGLPSSDEYEELNKDTVDSIKKIEIKPKVASKYVAKAINQKATNNILNEVYNLLIKHSPLVEEDFDYLLNERKLTDTEIKNRKFFSFRKNNNLNAFFKEVSSLGIDLNGVPGFFRYKNSKKWDYVKSNSIGMPILNEDGVIVGIQKRNDSSSIAKYTWFSSNNEDENRECGASSGSPYGLLSDLTDNNLIITEGLFKAMSIKKNFQNSSALYVQGVQNTKGVVELVQKVNPHKIGIAFDADLMVNSNVMDASIKLYDSLVEANPNKEVLFMTWDLELGKGIDDFLEVSSKEFIKYYNKEMLIEVRSKFIESTSLHNESFNHKHLQKNKHSENIKNVFNEIIEEDFNDELISFDDKTSVKSNLCDDYGVIAIANISSEERYC